MIDRLNQYEQIKALHGTATLLKEGGRPVVYLPGLSFSAAGRGETMDTLLVPFAHSGYDTRLFFERQIPERGSNWTQHRVVDRTWWAPSWNHVPERLPWTAMLGAHLRAVA